MLQILTDFKNYKIVEREQLLRQLDLKYTHQISQLLQQKAIIIQQIQHQYDQLINHINKLIRIQTYKTINIINDISPAKIERYNTSQSFIDENISNNMINDNEYIDIGIQIHENDNNISINTNDSNPHTQNQQNAFQSDCSVIDNHINDIVSNDIDQQMTDKIDSDHNVSNTITVANTVTNDVKYEDSYYISVHCHICKKHFDDICKYESHLKQHYDSDNSKTWRICDLGCTINPTHPLKTAMFTGIYSSASAFVAHISSHTFEYPFICKVNGCNHLSSTKSDHKKHWEKCHADSNCINVNKHKNRKRARRQKLININNTKEEVKNNSEPPNKRRIILRLNNSTQQKQAVSMHCIYCLDSFERYAKLRKHIRTIHPDKPYLCKYCPMAFEKANAVEGHHAQHTYDKAYKCSICERLFKCKTSFGGQGNLSAHQRILHCKYNKFEKRKKRKLKLICAKCLKQDEQWAIMQCSECYTGYHSYCNQDGEMMRKKVLDTVVDICRQCTEKKQSGESKWRNDRRSTRIRKRLTDTFGKLPELEPTYEPEFYDGPL